MAIKILIGGSPCTYWSIAQTNNRETKAEGMGWELFKNYLIAKEKFKPDFFLYENNKSAAQAIKDQIAEEFGVGVDPDVRFTYINSALVSAQNRQRFYVTNFGDIEQPEDRGILLKDILEGAITDRDKAHAVISSAGRTTTREYFDKQQGTMACEPVETDEMIPPCGQRNQDKARTLTSGYANKSQRDFRKDIETDGFMGAQGVIEPVNTTPDGKSQTIKAQYQQTSVANVCCYHSTYGATGVAEPIYIGEVPEHKGTYRNGKQASQQYRVYDVEGKGVSVTTSAITNVAEPVCHTIPQEVRVRKYTYDIEKFQDCLREHKNLTNKEIAEALGKPLTEVEHWFRKDKYFNIPDADIWFDLKKLLNIETAEFDDFVTVSEVREGVFENSHRCYDADGKMSTLLTSSNDNVIVPIKVGAIPVEWDENGIPTKAISCADGKTYTVYKIENGQITIKGKQYPIKLKDGYYIIRKLTVRECARLQTMPDDYCKAVSDSQTYKALGNGWTAEVIIHLLNHALKDVPRDEEIVVLSMYDGIATGRYCLDKMGFTNVTYHAYEIDKYPIQVAMDNYPDIIQHGDAFAVREDDWQPPQTRSEWLDELLGGEI